METNQSKKNSPTLGAPKNFIIPILLLHLRDWNAHGYELIEKLTKFGMDSLDQGNFYRILRQLEKDSLVTSAWDTTSGGPAKRIYSITEAGEQYLDMWAGPLSEYQKMLNQFFNLYNPFNFNFSGAPTKSKLVNEPTTTDRKSDEVSLNKAETKADVLTDETVTEDKITLEEQQKTAIAISTETKPAAKKPTTRRTTKPRTPRTTKPTAKAPTNSQSGSND